MFMIKGCLCNSNVQKSFYKLLLVSQIITTNALNMNINIIFNIDITYFVFAY